MSLAIAQMQPTAQTTYIQPPFESVQTAASALGLRTPERIARWTAALSVLEHAKTLTPNWDHDGAVPPDQRTLLSLINFIQSELVPDTMWPAPTRAAITSDGAIFIEWQEPGFYMDLECDTPGHADLLIDEGSVGLSEMHLEWTDPIGIRKPTENAFADWLIPEDAIEIRSGVSSTPWQVIGNAA